MAAADIIEDIIQCANMHAMGKRWLHGRMRIQDAALVLTFSLTQNIDEGLNPRAVKKAILEWLEQNPSEEHVVTNTEFTINLFPQIVQHIMKRPFDAKDFEEALKHIIPESNRKHKTSVVALPRAPVARTQKAHRDLETVVVPMEAVESYD